MADAKWCGHDSRGNETIRVEADGTERLLDDVPLIAERFRDYRSSGQVRGDHLGFLQTSNRLAGTILIPKYYDPELSSQLRALAETHDLPALGDFMDQGTLVVTTGVEVGKMAYGTGSVPFIRTSDLSNWELKADPKHGISDELYRSLRERHPDKLDVREGDIFLVKDGTYLVGTTAVVSQYDTRIVYQSHLFKLRVAAPERLDPWLLFVALNSPIVKRQIRAKRFTQDIIDTLGNRLAEIRLPLPKDLTERERVSVDTRRVLQERARLREEARRLALDIEGDAALRDLSSLEEVD